jgi:hypothetical protein
MRLAYRLMLAALVIAGMLSSTRLALGHHSGAEFDSSKTIEIAGTIKEFQFKNPHTWIQVLVDDGKTQPVEWSLEWGAPNSLGRQGYRPSTFPPGAKVTMRIHPMKNGSPAGTFIGAKFADGKTVGSWE